MTHRYHLLITRSGSPDYFAVERLARGDWLLPWSIGERRARATLVIAAALRQLRIHGWIVRMQLVAFSAADAVAEWACLVHTTDSVSGFQWTRKEDCHANDSLLPAQAMAVESIASDGRDLMGIGGPVWLAEVRQWIDKALDARGCGPTVGDAVQYRAMPTVSVLGFHTTTTDVFFRAAPPETMTRLRTTHERAPRYFPALLAVDETRGWLLTARARGGALSAPPGLGVLRSIVLAWKEAARLVPCEPALDFDRVERDLETLLARVNVAAARKAQELIVETCRAWQQLACPAVWCHGDPAPQNIFLDRDAVSFIDLEQAFFGPPALGVHLLWRGLADVGVTCPTARAQLEDLFVECWSTEIPSNLLRQSLRLAEPTWAMLRTWFELQEAPRQVRSGEVRCSLEPLLTRAALTLVKRLQAIRPTTATAAGTAGT